MDIPNSCKNGLNSPFRLPPHIHIHKLHHANSQSYPLAQSPPPDATSSYNNLTSHINMDYNPAQKAIPHNIYSSFCSNERPLASLSQAQRLAFRFSVPGNRVGTHKSRSSRRYRVLRARLYGSRLVVVLVW